VLLPPNTTVKFYSEAGQALVLPAKGGDFDYENKIAPAWQQLKETTEPTPSQGVVYNLRLNTLDSQEEKDAADAADWDGATVVKVDERTWLCQGTPDDCPTPDLNVRKSNGETIPDDRWYHHCNGMLGLYGGKGDEIHWVSCTSYLVDRHDLPPLITADEAGPGKVIPADWMPDDDAMAAIIDLNRRNIKEVDDGGEAALAVGGALLIIGANHKAETASYVKRQGDLEEGILTVTKGGAFSKGKMEVKGISPKNQEIVRRSIEEFSAKKVTFV
jgi:hypothetical protein